MEKKVKASARVRLVLELPVNDRWGGDYPMSQIQKQAKESALDILHAAVSTGSVPKSTLSVLLDHGAAKIIGEPQVIAILVENDDE